MGINPKRLQENDALFASILQDNNVVSICRTDAESTNEVPETGKEYYFDEDSTPFFELGYN